MKTTPCANRPDQKASTKNSEISLTLLAEIFGVSKQAISKKALANDWTFIEKQGRGGREKLFPIKSLPIDIRRKVLVHLGELPEEMATLVPIDFDRSKISKCSQDYNAAQEWQRHLARQRLEILECLDRFRTSFGGKRSQAVPSFIEEYGRREVEGLDPAIYDRIPVVKRSRIYEWAQRYNREGIAGLLSRHGTTIRGESKVPLDQQQFILGLIGVNPALKAAKIAKSLGVRFAAKAIGRRQVFDFLKRRKQVDPVLFAHLVDPDAAKGRYQLALGSASEKAERFLHYIEVDSTPADVMCADGKRHTIIGGIDIFSRKATFVVTKTSNSWGIAGLIREIAIDWGLPEHIVRDNGQDYASKMVNGGLTALGIEVCKVPPFTPEAKPHIERVFRTMSHDLLETLPGYIGHNVAERKGIENRRSFAERLGKTGRKISPKGRKDTAGRDARSHQDGDAGAEACRHQTNWLTPQELQVAINRWTEEVYHQRKHSTLGMSPNAKAAQGMIGNRRLENKRALDILLAPSGDRIVGKKGLRYENGLFWNDELIDYIGRTVSCRADVRDASAIFCFDPETRQFICEAVDLALSGMTLGEKIGARKRAKKRLNERVKAVKALGDGGDPFADEIAMIRTERATVTNLPVGEAATNPFIEGALEAAKAAENREEQPPEQPDWVPYEIERHKQIYQESSWRMYDPEPKKVVPLQSRNQEQVEKIFFSTPREKFEHFRLGNQYGWAIEEKDINWLKKYADDWYVYAEMFADTWPESDQKFIGKLAPHLFPQYAEAEEK